MILENGSDDELRTSFLFGAEQTVVRWLELFLHGDSFLRLFDETRLYAPARFTERQEIRVELRSSTESFRTWVHMNSLVIWYGVPIPATFEVACTDGDRSWFWDVQPPRQPIREHDILWVEIDRLLEDAPVCEQCKVKNFLVKPAPVMTEYAKGPQPQPPLCPECTEDWVNMWDDRWAEYNASR